MIEVVTSCDECGWRDSACPLTTKLILWELVNKPTGERMHFCSTSCMESWLNKAGLREITTPESKK